MLKTIMNTKYWEDFWKDWESKLALAISKIPQFRDNAEMARMARKWALWYPCDPDLIYEILKRLELELRRPWAVVCNTEDQGKVD